MKIKVTRPDGTVIEFEGESKDVPYGLLPFEFKFAPCLREHGPCLREHVGDCDWFNPWRITYGSGTSTLSQPITLPISY